MAIESKISEPTPTAPKPKTYRVLGIPIDWDRNHLESFLADHAKDGIFELQSLALEFDNEHQTATVDSLDGTPLRLDFTNASAKSTLPERGVQADTGFLGLTTLFKPAPEDHQVDVVAVCGLGGHAYGSYRNKTDYHMWLRDSLPGHITSKQSKCPIARVMTYGYKSPVSDSTSTQTLEDLAISLRQSLSALESDKPLILIGHSLGGLVVKQEEDHRRLYQTIYGVVFFGVPHHGMDMKELIAMSELGPNLGLLYSLSSDSSMVLDMLKRELHPALGQKGEREVVCFYETETSPTAMKLDNGKWDMVGPRKVLVTKASATHGREWESGEEHIGAISASHSEIVKIGRHAPHKRIVLNSLRDLSRRALEMPRLPRDPSAKFIVPYTPNGDFIGRENILNKVKASLELDKRPLDRQCRKVSLYGLGGMGKTQIAIAFAYWVQKYYRNISVLWVHASNADRFRQAYEAIAKEYDLPERRDPKLNILTVVCEFLSSRHEGQWLMIIDNADDRELFFPSKDQVNDKGEDLAGGLRQYIPTCSHGSVLVTTRDSKAGVNHMAGKAAIEVEKLSEDEAVQLLNRLSSVRMAAEDAVRLSGHLSGIPLALAQAVSFMNENTISVDRYCEILEESDSAFVDQLSEEFQTDGRDGESLNAVARTWMVSFDDVQRRDPLASKFLSIMSLFDRHAIPEELVIVYQGHLRDIIALESETTAQLSPAARGSLKSRMALLLQKRWAKKSSKELYLESRGKPREAPTAEPDQSRLDRTKSMGTLIAFSFITKNNNSYTMHRLVQLVTRKWLARKDELKTYGPHAVGVATLACPQFDWKIQDAVMRLLPHLTKMLADKEIEKETQALLERGLVLVKTGSYFHYLSQFDAALFYAEQAHRAYVQAGAGLGHRLTLSASNLILLIRKDQGRLEDEVIRFGESQLDLATSSLGKDHHTTHEITESLGSIHLQRGDDLVAAQDLFRRVEKTRRKLLGDRHPDTLNSMNNLALVYSKQGLLDRAEGLFLEVGSAEKELWGNEDPTYLNSRHSLADIYREKGDFDLAIEILTEVVEKKNKILGPEHIHTLVSMGALALNHAERGNSSQAYDIGVELLHRQRNSLGENHPMTLSSKHNHAYVLKDMGRTREAIDEMRACASHKSETLGAAHKSALFSKRILSQWEEELEGDPR